MKENFIRKKLTKRQRHQKKWIPEGIYCYDFKRGNCPFWKEIKNPIRKKEECDFGSNCNFNEIACENCNEQVTYCSFLHYKEYGSFPLGDMCKICGIHKKNNYK